MPVDNARTVEIVGGELAADAVSRKDSDAKASHLARYVAEYDVIVVELYSEHRIGERLNYLSLEFNLVFLCHELCLSGSPHAGGEDPVLKCAPSNYQ
jgi:hypothetical protein